MEISEINDFGEFIDLKDQWTELLQRSEHSVFSTWEWLSTWWRHFGKDKRLVILLAEENHKLIGIAPLMYSVHTMFGVQRGTIEFIGTGHPTYSSFVISNSHKKCLLKFFEHMNRFPQKWVTMELDNLSEDHSSLLGLNQIISGITVGKTCLHLTLPNSNNDFLSTIKRKDRKEFRRNLRRLEKDGFKIDFVDCSETNQINEGMKSLFSMHQKCWRTKGYSGKFCIADFRSFCLDIAKCFEEKGWLGLYCLKISGKPAASLYGFKYNSKYYAYITGMDPEYKKYSAGNLVFLKTIQKCTQDGLHNFDFMWGNDQYKWQWNPVSKYTFKVSVPGNGAISRFEKLLYEKYWSNGERLRYFYDKLLKRKNCV